MLNPEALAETLVKNPKCFVPKRQIKKLVTEAKKCGLDVTGQSDKDNEVILTINDVNHSVKVTAAFAHKYRGYWNTVPGKSRPYIFIDVRNLSMSAEALAFNNARIAMAIAEDALDRSLRPEAHRLYKEGSKEEIFQFIETFPKGYNSFPSLNEKMDALK